MFLGINAGTGDEVVLVVNRGDSGFFSVDVFSVFAVLGSVGIAAVYILLLYPIILALLVLRLGRLGTVKSPGNSE